MTPAPHHGYSPVLVVDPKFNEVIHSCATLAEAQEMFRDSTVSLVFAVVSEFATAADPEPPADAEHFVAHRASFGGDVAQ